MRIPIKAKSGIGHLRNKRDKIRSADDRSILKSLMNKDFSFKEERYSGIESVFPCRFRQIFNSTRGDHVRILAKI